MKNIRILVEFKRTEFFPSYGDCLLNTKLQVLIVVFSVAGLDHTKFGFYQFQSCLFIVVIVTSTLLKTAFSQTSIHSQSLVEIL